MRLVLVLALALALAGPAAALDHGALARRALDVYILPGVAALSAETAALAGTAESACMGDAEGLAAVRAGYHAAFDAWMGVAHLRLGPMQEGETGFAIAFWPDPRGATPRTLAGLVAAEDPLVDDPAAFATQSVAARGLFALEMLLFDPDAPEPTPGDYRCRLTVAVTRDLAAVAAGLEARWRDPWAGLLLGAGAPDHPLWFAPEEASRALFGALAEGLQATHDLRLGRPLGAVDRPQPRRAEAWRSGRSLRNVELALGAQRDLAAQVFGPELTPEDSAAVDAAFAAALAVAERVGAPLPEAVADPALRVRVEALAGAVERAREAVARRIGGTLGLTSGFNSMDGD